jgi:hypothetical protein
MYSNERASRSQIGLTRISVMGTNDGFLVRTGQERPAIVRNSGGRLVCECGSAGCAHVEAVVLCGFVEEHEVQQRAA